jgi:hypothetical protein
MNSATGRPAVGAKVRTFWTQFETRDGGRQALGTRSGWEVPTDSLGRYRVCRLPSNEEIEARATMGRAASQVVALKLGPGELKEVLLTVGGAN